MADRPHPLTIDQLRPMAHNRSFTVRVADVWPLIERLERESVPAERTAALEALARRATDWSDARAAYTEDLTMRPYFAAASDALEAAVIGLLRWPVATSLATRRAGP